MPIDRAELEDGSTIEYYVPVGTSAKNSEYYARAAVKKKARGEDPTLPPETTLGGYVKEAGKGLLSGAAGLVESAATGTAFLLPEEQEQAAREAIARKGAQVQADLAPRGGYEDTVVRKLAEATGSTVPFLATGFLGAPGLAAGIATGAAAGAGEAAKRAEAAGATEEQISEAAGLGILPGLGETLVPFGIGKSVMALRAARGLEKAVGEEVAQTALRRLRRVATSAGAEGLQEASAEVAQNLIAQGVYDPETGTFAGTGESLGYGAGVGGLLAALGELAIPGRPRITPQAQEQLKLIEGKERQMDMFPAELAGEVQVPRPPAPTEEYTGDIEPGAASDLSQFDLFDTRRGQKPISPRDLPVVAEPRIIGTPEGELILPGQEAEARQRAIEERENAVAERRQASEEARAAEGLPAGQLEMFSTEPATSPEAKRLNKLPIARRVGAFIGTDGEYHIRFKYLAEPDIRQETIGELEEWLKRTKKTAKPETRKKIASLLDAVRELDQTTTPGTDAQLDIEQQIDRDVVEEQARTAEQEREAAFGRAEQEREQARLDRTAAFEEAEAAREDQRAAEEVMARSEQEVSSQPTATALAIQEAQRRQQRADEVGRTVPGQEQMEFRAIPPADATIQELRDLEQRIAPEAQAVEASTEDQITEQGAMIGPQGGPRTRLPTIPKQEPSKNIAGDVRKIAGLKVKDPIAKFFKNMGPAKAIAQLAKDIDEKGFTAENEAAYRWVKENLSPLSNRRLGYMLAARRDIQGKPSPFPLPVDAIAETAVPVSQEVNNAVARGDLRAAFEAMLVDADPTVARAVRAILKAIGQTKVRMQSGLVNAYGRPIAGLFRPTTNEIIINPDVELTGHVLIHEALHAITSHELIRDTPAAKQMRRLFESIRDRLGTAYGTTNVDEFVAEAFSNPEFQAMLGKINEKGEKITFLQKFANIVRNIVRKFRGLETKKINTAMDSVDALLDSLISPAPQYRDGPDLYSATISERSAEVLDSVGKYAKKKGVRASDIDYASGFLRSAGRAVRRRMYSFLPMQAIVDVSKKDFPGISEEAELLFKVIEEKNGERGIELDKVKDTAAEIEGLLKGKEALTKVFNFVVGESTVLKVDPTKPRSTYATNPAKQDDWDYLNREINKLPEAQRKEFREAYTKLRDAYKLVYTDLVQTLENRLNAIDMDPEARKTIKDNLLKRLTKDHIDPYFPLYRKGTHWLTYEAINPRTGSPEVYQELFESEAQRAVAVGKLKDIKATNIKTFERDKTGKMNLNAVDARWAYGVFEDLRKAGVSQEAQDIVLDALLDAMPEKSALNAFRSRKGILGFEQDAMKVFRERMPNFVSQKVNLKYDLPLSQMSRAIQEAADQYNGSAKQNHAVDLNEAFQGYIDFARNPRIATWSKALKSAGFGMTLGFNVSSVIVNATNLPVVVLPYLGGKFGFSNAAKAMNAARKNFMRTGTRRKREGFAGPTGDTVWDGPSLTNMDFTNPDAVPEGMRHYATLAQLLRIRGQANRSTTSEALEYENTANSLWTRTNAYMGWLFHQGERANRQITAMAAYDLYLQNLEGAPTQKDYEAAAEYALETTELTNSGAMLETAPRIAQNNWGSWMMMYKRFGISMLYLQAKMARQAISGIKDKGERAEAWRQIGGLFAMSALFAGVQGVPLYGVLSFIMNQFRDEDEEDFDSMVARTLGEGLYSGPVNALTNLDIAPRIGMTNLIFRSLPNKEQESLIMRGMELFGGPVFGIASRMEGGINMISEGEIVRGLERLLPSVLGNAIKGTRYGIEGATTLRGDPIVEDLNPWNVFAQVLGFAPAEYMKQIELNAKEKRIDRNISEKQRKLLRRYHLARRVGDTDEMADIREEMLEFNKKHPEIRITPRGFEQSMNQHRVTDAITRQLGGITINRRRIPAVLAQRLEETGD